MTFTRHQTEGDRTCPTATRKQPHPPAQHHVVLGAGPVGRAIVAQLVEQGITPTVVTRSGTGVPGASPDRADITDPAQLAAAIAGADGRLPVRPTRISPLAGGVPRASERVSIDAVSNSGALLVVVENLYGYGPVDGETDRDLPLRATTKKGAVRARMYLDLVEAHQAGRIRMVVARASDFFGPHVDGSAFGERFVSQVTAGRKVDILGDPEALHSVTYVPDLGAAMVRLASEPGRRGDALGTSRMLQRSPSANSSRSLHAPPERSRRSAVWPDGS